MSKQEIAVNEASCLCGKVRFQVTEFLPVVGHCHCTMCRKFHGAAFSTFAEVRDEHLHWLSGQDILGHYHADNDSIRSFCQHCGSSLLFSSKHNRQDGTIEVAIAAFDHIETVKPSAHIYTESKVDWLSINDGLPQYMSYRK